MKNSVLFFLLFFFISGLQDVHAVKFDAGGGFSAALYVPDLSFINDKLQEVTPGFEDVDKSLFTWGGLGYVRVSERIRIGGYGFGGYNTISGAYINGDHSVSQDVYFEMGGGGFYTEYITPSFHDKFEGVVSLGIGGIGFSMRINQVESTTTWDNVMDQLTPGNERENILIEMGTGGFLLHPGIGLKYYITPYFAIEGNASYILFLLEGDWEFCGSKVRNMPDHNLSAPLFGLRLIFGG